MIKCNTATLYLLCYVKVRTTLLTQQICGVEKVDRVAFKKANIGQVVLKNLHGNTEILYIQGKVSITRILQLMLCS